MIIIVDYGMGNLRSVQKAFERVGFKAAITSDPQRVLSAEKLVLPGVGAFSDAMHELAARGLIEPICEVIARGTPFLGICLGLQLLFEESEEGGTHRGFGILGGKVVRFPETPGLTVPHMGWNQIQIHRDAPLFRGIADGAHFYFVHSFYVEPVESSIVATTTDYAGPFCSMIWRDYIFATQFHPEKSQSLGLQFLKNFAEL